MSVSIGVRGLRARVFESSQLENLFICRQCLTQQRALSIASRSRQQSMFLKAFRQSGHYRIRNVATQAFEPPSATLTEAASVLQQSKPRMNTQTSFPEVSSKAVGRWLLFSAASVFGIVVFGGLTRLTESGLSITEWRPVTGSLPPLNEQIWQEEFARYKQSPEFIMLNSRMDLEDFKKIYWMEWTHRLWGRVIGITTLVPTIYFIARRRVSKPMAFKITGICGLIGFQGFLGWWMVKSGLKDQLLETGSHPRVSQYRLAAHLGTAFVVYLAMLWNGMSILRAHDLLKNPAQGLQRLDALQHPRVRAFGRLVKLLSLLTFTTAMSGALVAGLDAGLIYNDFPWMGQGLLPPKVEILDPHYSRETTQSDLLWRNMLENPVLVQLDHRILATTTFSAVIALWTYSRFSSRLRAALPRNIRVATLGIVHLVSLQVVLGITTLWYLVPTPLAAAHQAGALALLSGVVVLGNRLSSGRRIMKVVHRAAQIATKTSSIKSTSTSVASSLH